MIEEARSLAMQLHAKQIRKSNGLPYVTHLEEVANIVANYKGSDIAIAAAWLHDSIEDQQVDESLIHPAVLSVVKELSEEKSLSWEVRKKKAVDDIALLSADALLVKAADVLSNLRGIMRDSYKNPEFWKPFKRGRRQTIGFYTSCVLAIERQGWKGYIAIPLCLELDNMLTLISHHDFS